MTDDEFAAQQRRGRTASELLESDAWAEALAELTAEINAEWAQTAWDANASREQRFAELKGLQMLTLRLQTWVGDAKYEAAQRDRRRNRA